MILLILFLIGMRLAYGLETSESMPTKIIEAWHIPSDVNYLDISDRLIDQTNDKSCQKILKEGKRKIFLFRYPSDGKMLKGYISYVPEQKSESAVLFLLRGGTRMFGLMNPANRASCYGPYTVIGLSYRDGVSPGRDEYGGDDVADVKNLLEYFPVLAKRFKIPLRAYRYLLGFSRGGMQMFLALNRYKNIQAQFKAVMSISGLLDLRSLLRFRPDMHALFREQFNMTPENQEDWLLRRDPLANTAHIKRDLPIIIVQAAQDKRVSIADGRSMVKKLMDQGFKDVRYIEIDHALHSLSNLKNDMEIIWQLFGEEQRY